MNGALAAVPAGFVPGMAVLLLVVAIDAWVYIDAKHHRELGTPVGFRAGGLRLETPEAWLLACIVLWVIAVPLYAAARRN